jgi:hypothetical protein
VASYAIKCLLAESAIFSIRDGAGAPLSTFEVRVPADGPPELLRHHATANAAPCEQEQAVARRFIERVLAMLPGERIGSVQQAHRELGLRVRALLGKPDTLQEPLTPEELGRLGEAITIAHPAEARRAGVVAFLEQHGPAGLSAIGSGSPLLVVALTA